MSVHLIFFLGPPGAGKDKQAGMFAKKLEGAVKVVSIGDEFREMPLVSPNIYDSILRGRIKRNNYTIARFNDEVDEALEKNEDMTLIFADLLNDEGDLWEISKTVRKVGLHQITMDFVHLNFSMEEAGIRAQQIQESLIAVIRKSDLNIDLIEIDANRNAVEVQEDLLRELVGRNTVPEKELISIPRPELI